MSISIKNKFILIGGSIGLLISIIIFIPFLIMSMEGNYKQRQFYNERYKLCESCGIPRNLNCVMEKCVQERTKAYKQFIANPLHEDISLENFLKDCLEEAPDIASGHPESFINGFCGYEQWRGFDYGSKPSKIGTFFKLHTIKDGFNYLVMLFGLLGFLILILPILIGIFIGWIVYKIKSKNTE